VFSLFFLPGDFSVLSLKESPIFFYLSPVGRLRRKIASFVTLPARSPSSVSFSLAPLSSSFNDQAAAMYGCTNTPSSFAFWAIRIRSPQGHARRVHKRSMVSFSEHTPPPPSFFSSSSPHLRKPVFAFFEQPVMCRRPSARPRNSSPPLSSFQPSPSLIAVRSTNSTRACMLVSRRSKPLFFPILFWPYTRRL